MYVFSYLVTTHILHSGLLDPWSIQCCYEPWEARAPAYTKTKEDRVETLSLRLPRD